MDLLALIAIFIILLVLVELYNRDDSKIIEKLTYDAELVVPGITSRCSIVSGDSTYTENKNKIYILLRDSSGKYYDFNTLFYALLHEIAHVLTTEIGHTKMFIAVFENLLNRANELGIYEAGKVDLNYCKQCMV